MFAQLEHLLTKPAPFAECDTSQLWADPHVSGKMLELHLDDSTVLASRPSQEITAITEWITRHCSLQGKTLVDLGCGPGLYAKHFHLVCEKIIGLDISPASIEYARNLGLRNAEFRSANYLIDEIPDADVVTLLYGDVCALSKDMRDLLFARVHKSLPQGGFFVLDAFSTQCFQANEGDIQAAMNLDDGFWSAQTYYGLKKVHSYPEERITLSRYLIVERDTYRAVSNWMKFFEPQELGDELTDAGFTISMPLYPLSGEPISSLLPSFFFVAEKPES